MIKAVIIRSGSSLVREQRPVSNFYWPPNLLEVTCSNGRQAENHSMSTTDGSISDNDVQDIECGTALLGRKLEFTYLESCCSALVLCSRQVPTPYRQPTPRMPIAAMADQGKLAELFRGSVVRPEPPCASGVWKIRFKSKISHQKPWIQRAYGAVAWRIW